MARFGGVDDVYKNARSQHTPEELDSKIDIELQRKFKIDNSVRSRIGRIDPLDPDIMSDNDIRLLNSGYVSSALIEQQLKILEKYEIILEILVLDYGRNSSERNELLVLENGRNSSKRNELLVLEKHRLELEQRTLAVKLKLGLELERESNEREREREQIINGRVVVAADKLVDTFRIEVNIHRPDRSDMLKRLCSSVSSSSQADEMLKIAVQQGLSSEVVNMLRPTITKEGRDAAVLQVAASTWEVAGAEKVRQQIKAWNPA